MSGMEIRPFQTGDYGQWRPLWDGYLTFYESNLEDSTTDHLWRVLVNQEGPMFGLGAFLGTALLGITHYTFHASSWTPGVYCYLEDLFTDPSMRGRGTGTALIEAVAEKARNQNAARLYWNTQNNNAAARSVYDKLAKEAGFVQYRMAL